MAPSPHRILLVDDRTTDRELAALTLKGALPHLEITDLGDAVGFAERLAAGDFDLLVCERHLGWGDGLQLLAAVRRRLPHCPVLFFTAGASPEAALEAQRAGLDDLIPKSSAGYLRLPAAVEVLLARGGGEAGARQLLECLPVGVLQLDAGGVLKAHNGACARLLGAAESARLEGTPLPQLLTDDGEAARLRESLAAGQAVGGRELALRGLGGQTQWLRLSLWPAAGEAGRFDGTLEDIGPYKRREQELGRSNDELERFAYVASHDLQEPLSLIERYGELLRTRLAGRGEAELEGYLDHLLASSRRSQTLVDDLLSYARIGTRGRPFEPVDFGAALDAAVANLQTQFAATEGRLQRAPLPTLAADGNQIIQLFQNLLGNALKFHGDRPPEIAVSARPEGETWRFEVRDRGIGIDPAQHQRIFEMFQRLHTAEEYPGTGIGLAICKAIVERHGGRLWVESRPGEGAAFLFTLPS